MNDSRVPTLIVGPILFPEMDDGEFVKGHIYKFEAHFFVCSPEKDVPEALGHRVFEVLMREVPCVQGVTLESGEFSQPVLGIFSGPLYRIQGVEYIAEAIRAKLMRHYGKKDVNIIGTRVSMIV